MKLKTFIGMLVGLVAILAVSSAGWLHFAHQDSLATEVQSQQWHPAADTVAHVNTSDRDQIAAKTDRGIVLYGFLGDYFEGDHLTVYCRGENDCRQYLPDSVTSFGTVAMGAVWMFDMVVLVVVLFLSFLTYLDYRKEKSKQKQQPKHSMLGLG
jgi:hypothetical protein